MAITSDDINNQSFSIDRKGYDVDEVDEFLEFVANEIDLLNETVAALQDKLAAAEDALAAQAAQDEEYEEGVLEEEPEEEEFEDEPEAEAAEDEPEDEEYEEEEEEYEEYDDEEYERMEARIAELEGQLAEKSANDNAIAQALVIAQRTAGETVAKAHDDADQIIADARIEASRIIEEANAEKEDIEAEIVQLGQDCEDMRGRFQGILTDFINDATTKLADISEASILASAQARTSKAAARGYETPVVASFAEPLPAAAGFTVPVYPVEKPATPAAPMAFTGGERDLSGFGDTVNESEFDDLD